MNESRALLLLNLTPGWGPAKIQKEIARAGTARRVVEANRLPSELAMAEEERARENQTVILTLGSTGYPASLEHISCPPPVLYAQGDLSLLEPSLPRLTIVGSRNPTAYGRSQAARFASSLARSGVTIVSGMARGIDEEAHRAALQARGGSVAILGCGLLRFLGPDPHLDRELKRSGLLLSEFPLKEPARKQNFPRRNRILAGLSPGVFVVEAAVHSGTRITARFALDQNAELFILPGQVDNPLSRGCHALLREGAHLAEEPRDIMEIMEWRAPRKSRDPDHAMLEELESGVKSLSQLSRSLKIPEETLLVELVKLEIEGAVVRLPGGLFRAR